MLAGTDGMLLTIEVEIFKSIEGNIPCWRFHKDQIAIEHQRFVSYHTETKRHTVELSHTDLRVQDRGLDF